VEAELLLANDPLPSVIHEPVLVEPVTVAARVMVLLVEHNVTLGGEIVTVACRKIADITVALTAGQTPLFVDVSV
jgi:hypothetical protein